MFGLRDAGDAVPNARCDIDEQPRVHGADRVLADRVPERARICHDRSQSQCVCVCVCVCVFVRLGLGAVCDYAEHAVHFDLTLTMQLSMHCIGSALLWSSATLGRRPRRLPRPRLPPSARSVRARTGPVVEGSHALCPTRRRVTPGWGSARLRRGATLDNHLPDEMHMLRSHRFFVEPLLTLVHTHTHIHTLRVKTAVWERDILQCREPVPLRGAINVLRGEIHQDQHDSYE